MLLFVVMYIGTFHQFDGIMCPEKTVKTGAWSRFGGWLGGSSVPNHDKNQQKSLHVYLQSYKDMLVACKVTDISSIFFIFHMFCQLHSPKVHYDNCSHPWPTQGVLQVCTCTACVNGSKLL